MVLLRVADYLQIQPARAPVFFGKIHAIKSPFSLGEWKLHQCIENITTSAMDPEAISVLVNPKSVHEYLRFEDWMRGFQDEIDKSWAILGEVYGRFTREALNKLQLNTRRVRSNLEDKTSLQKKAGFVPEAIRFTVSEPELLRLLMEPLYGDNPTYGLRELVQNAADSVNELEHALRGAAATIDRAQLNHDIEIKIVGAPDWSFIIEDRGTGMTLETIKNYFLKAGASFRNSELWKQDFTDQSGKSQIARTGRFGVGALSAYLIGERVKIFTRHYTEKTGHGFSFLCSIDDEQIEITQVRGPVGTTIQIWSSEKSITVLQRYLAKRKTRPFFYLAPKLTIGFDLSGDFPPIPQIKDYEATAEKRSEEALARSPQWVTAECEKYENVAWDRTSRYLSSESYYGRNSLSGYLYSNGILVGDVNDPSKSLLIEEARYGLLGIYPPPTVSIVDHNANLPVDLARKGSSRPDPELLGALERSVYNRLIEEIALSDINSATGVIEWWRGSDFPISGGAWFPFLFGSAGFCLLDRALLHLLKLKKLIIQTQTSMAHLERQLRDKFCESTTCIAFNAHQPSSARTGLLNYIQASYYESNLPKWHDRRAEPSYFTKPYLLLEREAAKSLLTLARTPNYVKRMASEGLPFEAKNKEFIIVSDSSNFEGTQIKDLVAFHKRTLKSERSSNYEPLALYVDYSSKYNEATLVSDIWLKSFDGVLLPYDRQERLRCIKKNAPIKIGQ
jgi:hypothetical protein